MSLTLTPGHALCFAVKKVAAVVATGGKAPVEVVKGGSSAPGASEAALSARLVVVYQRLEEIDAYGGCGQQMRLVGKQKLQSSRFLPLRFVVILFSQGLSRQQPLRVNIRKGGGWSGYWLCVLRGIGKVVWYNVSSA